MRKVVSVFPIGLDTIGISNIQQEPILHQNQNLLRKGHPLASIEQSKTWYDLAVQTKTNTTSNIASGRPYNMKHVKTCHNMTNLNKPHTSPRPIADLTHPAAASLQNPAFQIIIGQPAGYFNAKYIPIQSKLKPSTMSTTYQT